MIKKYLVIGNPIEHSLSPKLHNYWFNKNNIDAVYDKKQINEADIKEIISEVRNGKIDGINVTVPFKKSVIPFIDELKLYLSKIKDEDLYAYNVYQIEGEGRSLFSKIEGDEDTIMGLPIKQIKKYLNTL